MPLFEVDAVALDEDEVEVAVGVGRGIELKDIVEAPGMGTRTVPVGPYISVLAYVEHWELCGGTAAPSPGIGWLSLAQDSKTPSLAFEGALNPHPWVS